VFVVPETEPVNCFEVPVCKDADVGESDTATEDGTVTVKVLVP
jgi:hypothetical protein